MHALHHIQHRLRARHKVGIAHHIRTASAELHVQLHDTADDADHALGQEGEVDPLQDRQSVVVLGTVVVGDGDQRLGVGPLGRGELEVEPVGEVEEGKSGDKGRTVFTRRMRETPNFVSRQSESSRYKNTTQRT